MGPRDAHRFSAMLLVALIYKFPLDRGDAPLLGQRGTNMNNATEIFKVLDVFLVDIEPGYRFPAVFSIFFLG